MADFQYLSAGSKTINGYAFSFGATTTVPNDDWATIRKLRRHASFMETSSPAAATQGAQGIPGEPGPKGDQGDPGPQGAAGPKGDKGETGSAGATGGAGAQGIQGPSGPTGAKGDTGSQGSAGATGSTGPQGATGPQGLKGDTGDAGPAGAQGIQGIKGDTGNTGAAGSNGAQGIQGVAGVRTDTSVFGYTAGSGGTVTQLTSKATAVTLNNPTGDITMNAAALAAATIVTFVFNNSSLVATDQLVCTHHSGGTFGAYTINGRVTGAGAASIAVRNNSAASLSEAIVIKYKVIR